MASSGMTNGLMMNNNNLHKIRFSKSPLNSLLISCTSKSTQHLHRSRLVVTLYSLLVKIFPIIISAIKNALTEYVSSDIRVHPGTINKSIYTNASFSFGIYPNIIQKCLNVKVLLLLYQIGKQNGDIRGI